MSTPIKHFAFVLLLAMLAPLAAVHGAVLTFDPMVTTDFNTMTAGHAVNTLTPPWTGTDASSIVAAAPAGTGNSSAMALTAPGAVRLAAVSPQQSLPTEFTNATTGDTLYFSSWLLKNGGGGGILFNSSNATSGFAATLGGFGMADGNGGAFTYYNGTSLATSSIAPERNTWYEIALVITLDTTNYANSIGTIYYRKATDTEFSILPEFNGVKMSWWTPSLNATDFAYYRIEGARNNLQIDNLSVGMATIPEPGASILSGAALVTLAFFAKRRRK